jgi:hypothetical protein
MIEESLDDHPDFRPKREWRRMDQVLGRGMVTAPRESDIPTTPANRKHRRAIQKIHLFRVQRDIISFQLDAGASPVAALYEGRPQRVAPTIFI